MKKLTIIWISLAFAACLVASPQYLTERAEVHDRVHVVVRDPAGHVTYDAWTHNLEPNAGLDWQASVMGNTAAPPATCNYLAVTADTGTPAATDTTLTGEITTNGLARTQGTYAHTAAATTYTIAHTWTATGTQTVNRAGMFNAATVGTMCFESATFASGAANLTNGSTLALTWTITY